MMITFLYGEQYPILKKKIKSIVDATLKEGADEMNCITLSARQVLIQDILYEASLIPLGSDHKVIIVKDAYFLSSAREKVSIDKDQKFELLEKFLAQPNTFCDLIFVLESKLVATKSNLYKLMQKHGKIEAVQEMTGDQFALVAGQFFTKKNVKISKEALQELLFRVGSDLSAYTNEAQKLCLYSKSIEIEDVKALVPIKLEENAFAIAEELMKGNAGNALSIYYDLRIKKEEPVRLIALIASQFRILSQVGYLVQQNRSNEEIAKDMGIHPYRIKLAVLNLQRIPYSQSLHILQWLYLLDYEIKSGQIDPYFGFEMFILQFSMKKRKAPDFQHPSAL